MFELTQEELDKIHAEVDAEIVKKGVPTDAELQREIDKLNEED